MEIYSAYFYQLPVERHRNQSPDLRASRQVLPKDLRALEELASSVSNGSGPFAEVAQPKLSRFGSFSRSLKGSFRKHAGSTDIAETSFNESSSGGQMPTILERNQSTEESSQISNGVRNVLSSIANAPQRLSQTIGHSIGRSSGKDDEENANLTTNIEP